MSSVGLIGCGKLGLPIAVCLARRHKVVGFDVNPALRRYREYEHREAGPDGTGSLQTEFFKVCLEGAKENSDSGLIFADDVASVMKRCKVVFVAVQTPHGPEYEGITRVPAERADFDYTYLKQAVSDLLPHAKPDHILVIISTVMPGTLRREILPLTKGRCRVVYNPGFPAMSTVMSDYLHPEFVLLGADEECDAKKLTALEVMEGFYEDFYRSQHPLFEKLPPILSMSVESAELAKVAYNLAISLKLEMVNYLGEICHRLPGCDVDSVTGVLKAANKRIVSARYMDAGGLEGGACLSGDTLVNTQDGMVPIRFLAENFDEVLVRTYDKSCKDGQAYTTRVAKNIRKTRTGASLLRIGFTSGGHIDCTPDHVFSRVCGTSSEEVAAEGLKNGDRLSGLCGSREVCFVRPLPGEHDVYCMEVPDVGWFFANNVLVHNCHPRDAIAMSWLARKLDLTHDLFGYTMENRERQAEWYGDLLIEHAGGLPLVLLGKSYKPESAITTGSSALLVANILREKGYEFEHYDPFPPFTDKCPLIPEGKPGAFLITTKHACFKNYEFPAGSVVVDPFRFIPPQEGVKIIPIGIGGPTA